MQTRIFKVALLGINKYDQQVLSSIFWLSNNRTRVYRPATLQEGVDLAIVDHYAPADWQRLQAQYPRLPVVRIGEAADGSPYALSKPFIATRVLRLLDQLTIQELAYAPDLVVGQAQTVAPEVRSALLNARQPGSGLRVLVVDDSAAIRKLMELELKIHQLQPDFAETAAQAFERLSNFSYDLIFLDVVLPDLDGYQICRAIKQDVRKRQVPVVMLTSKSSPFDRIRGKLAGCNSYLSKPVSHEQMSRIIQQYLGASVSVRPSGLQAALAG